MNRSLAFLFALIFAAPGSLLPPSARASDRALPMRFELYRQNPAEGCGAHCRMWIGANGAITADTPRDFQNFAHGRDLHGLTIALDSDGGSVLGAIGLGREIRKLSLNTTVGHTIALGIGDARTPFANLSPRADCQSMCAFVLLAGVQRAVPPEARVMVHQIWLGDRREDPTAANYSAEDLVLVQRDIGRLAQYTIDMGISIDLLDLSLRIPPWEPMHLLSANELRQMRVATDSSPPAAAAATVAASPPSAAAPAPLTAPMGNVARATPISEQHWAMINHAGGAALARRHPLTIEGDEIGTFDLIVTCAGRDGYDVSYAERRHGDGDHVLPDALTAITMTAGGQSVALKVVSSVNGDGPDELVTFATATVPASLISAFAAAGNHSLVVVTRSASVTTAIRLGNTGALANLPRLTASCIKPLGDRAELSAKQMGGVAVAK